MTETKKLWSQQTVEERVYNLISHQEKVVNELDPNDQFLTHDNYMHKPVKYHIVDLNRHFLQVLKSIVDSPSGKETNELPPQ